MRAVRARRLMNRCDLPLPQWPFEILTDAPGLKPGAFARDQHARRSALDEGHVPNARCRESRAYRAQRTQPETTERDRRHQDIVTVIQTTPTIAATLIDGPALEK